MDKEDINKNNTIIIDFDKKAYIALDEIAKKYDRQLNIRSVLINRITLLWILTLVIWILKG